MTAQGLGFLLAIPSGDQLQYASVARGSVGFNMYKRVSLFIGGIVAAGFAVAITAAQAPIAPAGSVDKWEYGEIHYRIREARPDSRVPQTYVRWLTLQEDMYGTTWEELAAKLKAPAAAKDTVPERDRLRVLNHLGEQGWEWAQRYREQGTDLEVWTLKRKIKK